MALRPLEHREPAALWVRDVTYNEDLSQVKTGHAPRVMATAHNTAISLLRLDQHRPSPTTSRQKCRTPHRAHADLLKLDFAEALHQPRTAHLILLRSPHCVIELKELYLLCLVDGVERCSGCRVDSDHQGLLELVLYSEARLRQRPAAHDDRFGTVQPDRLLYRFS